MLKIKTSHIFVAIVLGYCFCACNNQNTNPSAKQRKVINTDTLRYLSNKTQNHLILNAVIDENIKVKLIYDTGNPYNLYLDSAFTVRNFWFEKNNLKAKKVDEMTLVEEIKNRNTLLKKALKFSIGGIHKNLTQTYVGNLQKVIKNDADGLIGNKFMEKYLVEINYEQKYLVLHKPNAKINFKDFISIPVEYKGFIWMKIKYLLGNGKSFEQDVAVDLGNGKNALVIASNRLINKFGIYQQLTNSVEKKRTTTMWARDIKTIDGNIKSIQLANTLVIDTPRVSLLINEKPKERNSSGFMLIGNYVFKKFGRIFIDYKNKKIYVPKAGLKNNIRFLN